MKNKKRGSLLMWGMIVLMILGAMVGVVQQTFVGSTKSVVEDSVVWKSQELANNLIELTKFLFLYERVVYTDSMGPLNHLGSNDRSRNMITVLGRGIGLDKVDPLSLGSICGAYDLKGASLGTFKIGGVSAFCPYFVRIPQLTSKEMEVVLFENWAKKSVVQKESPGVYKIEIDFTKSLSSFDQSFINWASVNERDQYLALLSKISKAYVILKFFTESSGFTSNGNDRTLSIEARVEFKSILSSKAGVIESEAFVMRPSMPKDYTAFFLYPTTSANTATRSFSSAVNIGSSSVISGRTYFNGDLDKPLNSLPTFKEFSVFSGALSPRPKISDEATLRSKFPKGLLTHFSSERWLFSGNCDSVSPSTNIINQSGYRCRNSSGTNLSMIEFFSLVPNSCTDAPVSITSGSFDVGFPNCSVSSSTSCPTQCPGNPEVSIVGYPLIDLKIQGSHAFVVAPVAKVIVNTSDVNLYGSLFGGYLNSSGRSINLIGAPSWATGMPGFPNSDTLNFYNQRYLSSTAGITAPLINMPIVYSASSGVK